MMSVRAYISNMVIPSAPPTCCSNLLLASVTNHKKVQREGEGSRNSSFHTNTELETHIIGSLSWGNNDGYVSAEEKKDVA